MPFFQDIYLEYFGNFRASRLQFGTDTVLSPSSPYMALVILLGGSTVFANEEKDLLV